MKRERVSLECISPPPSPLILELLCTFLRPREIVPLMGVCQEWRNVCGSDRVWTRFKDEVIEKEEALGSVFPEDKSISLCFINVLWNTKGIFKEAQNGIANSLHFLMIRLYLSTTIYDDLRAQIVEDEQFDWSGLQLSYTTEETVRYFYYDDHWVSIASWINGIRRRITLSDFTFSIPYRQCVLLC